MRHLTLLFAIGFVMLSCDHNKEISSINPVNWKGRTAELNLIDSLEFGETYLSVYSEIYMLSEVRTYDLTVTVSMRNTNKRDTIYMKSAEYYDTKGNLIRNYFEQPIFIAPMETVEIVIDENDRTGGTGANFMFDWWIKPGTHEPLFEGVMISTSGQQGLSFVTHGKRVE